MGGSSINCNWVQPLCKTSLKKKKRYLAILKIILKIYKETLDLVFHASIREAFLS